MSKSFYCLCKNRYLAEHLCNCEKQPYYWKQGIGRTVALVIKGTFDYTFDNTFTGIEQELGSFDNTFDITFN